jgi:hypothetical protein
MYFWTNVVSDFGLIRVIRESSGFLLKFFRARKYVTKIETACKGVLCKSASFIGPVIDITAELITKYKHSLHRREA